MFRRTGHLCDRHPRRRFRWRFGCLSIIAIVVRACDTTIDVIVHAASE
jgi:hypothetical protein